MKKMLLVALLGLGLVLASGQRASAWSKYSFGVGLNCGYEGGGNSVLWGLFRGEQPPVGYCPEPMGAPEMPMGPALPAPLMPPAHGSAPAAQPGVSRAVYAQPYQQPEAVGYSMPVYAAPSYWYGR